tara:strand:- start:668 stop:1288 length:621 start_codon:yes stop_codon:yes gene_type:complete
MGLNSLSNSSVVYAKKLDIKCPEIMDIDDRPQIEAYGKLRITKCPSIVRWKLTEVEQFINLFPKLKPYLYKSALTKIMLLTPHVHTNEKTIINFYFSPGNEVTSFWDGDEYIRDDRLTIDNGDTYYNVHAANLDVKYRFIAQAGDVWILNTAKAHSLLPDESFESNMKTSKFRDRQLINYNKKITRTAVQLAFIQPIEEILTILYG